MPSLMHVTNAVAPAKTMATFILFDLALMLLMVVRLFWTLYAFWIPLFLESTHFALGSQFFFFPSRFLVLVNT
jgi:hypothetical protein